MHNLLEYSDNYSMTSRSLCNYYRDEVNDEENEYNTNNNRLNKNKTITSKYFEHKRKIIGKTPAGRYIRFRSCCSIEIFG